LPRSFKGASRGIDPPFLRRRVAGKLPHHGVEGRREQKAEAGYTQHPEEYRRAQRTPHFGACPVARASGCLGVKKFFAPIGSLIDIHRPWHDQKISPAKLS
jgi:hypothetical protein